MFCWPNDKLTYFTAVSMTHLLVEIFLSMHLAILPFLMRDFNITIVQAGVVLTVPSIVRLSLNLPSGALADKIDSRYLLILSAALSGFGAVVVSQAPNVFYLVIGLCTLMMAVTMYHPPGLSIISKLFSRGKLTNMIGVHGATGSIGQGLGILSMSFVIRSHGWRSCYLLWSILIFGWSIILTKLPSQLLQLESQHLKKNVKEKEESLSVTGWKKSVLKMMTGKSYLLLILAVSMVGLGNQMIFSFITTYFVQIRNMPEDAAALIFGIGPMIGIFGSLIGGYLSSKFGDKKFLFIAFFGLAVSVSSLVCIPLIGFVILSFLVYRWFFASIWPASTSLVCTLTPESGRGMAYSIFFFVPGILGAVSPIVGALIIEGFSILSMFPFALVLFLASSIVIRLS